MTNQKKTYIRRVGKIDEVIAYVGGLFGLIFTVFSCCITSYNKYSYELTVAEASFKNDQYMSKIREKHFSFLHYLKYHLFRILSFMFCSELNWTNSKKIK